MQILKYHGYKSSNYLSKVGYFNYGIKNNNPDTIKSNIISSADYAGDFDVCVTLYKDFINQSDGQLKLNVAAMKIYGGNGGDKVDYGKDTKEVANNYYTKF